MPGFEDEEEEI